jgi:hypothetical protein
VPHLEGWQVIPQPTEPDLWQSNLDALRWAVTLRKPDAIARLKLQVERLDGEISALVLRRTLAEASAAWPAVVHLSDRIAALEARMGDLRAIGDLVRSSPLDHDDGANPEAARKANGMWDADGNLRGFRVAQPGTDDLADDLKRAAGDIRSGWLVITKRSTAAVSGKQPGGDLDSGKPAILAEQYYHWVSEMHRKRMATFVHDDVVCEGLSRAECAGKRRFSQESVYDLLVEGLRLYAERYPPLSDGGV